MYMYVKIYKLLKNKKMIKQNQTTSQETSNSKKRYPEAKGVTLAKCQQSQVMLDRLTQWCPTFLGQRSKCGLYFVGHL